MKYFVLLLLAALVHSEDNYVLKTRADSAKSSRACMATLGITSEIFMNSGRRVDSDKPLVQSIVTCVFKDFGLFDETKGFNRDRMVKQLGGETVRVRVQKCIDNFQIDGSTVNKSVMSVLDCLEKDGLEMYGKEPSKSDSQN